MGALRETGTMTNDEESFPIREALQERHSKPGRVKQADLDGALQNFREAAGFVPKAPDPVGVLKAATPDIPWGANLGLATTEQLLLELRSRGEVPEPGDDPELSHELARSARLMLRLLTPEMRAYRPAKGGSLEQRMLDLLKHGDREALESVLAAFAAKYGDPVGTVRLLDIVREYLPILEQFLKEDIAVTNGG